METEYKHWHQYKADDKLPKILFKNSQIIDLSQKQYINELKKLAENELLMYYEYQIQGCYLPCNGKTNYIYGQSFALTKEENGDVCLFLNGCKLVE